MAEAIRLTNPEILEILRRGKAGDAIVLPDIRRLLDEYPDFSRQLSDVAAHAQEALIVLAADTNVVAAEAIRRRLVQLREDLCSETPSALERLLAERVSLCWLAMYICECQLGEQLHQPTANQPLLRTLEKRLDGAHRRFLSAARSLATAQKLLRPALSPLEMLKQPITEGATPSRGGRLARQEELVGIEN